MLLIVEYRLLTALPSKSSDQDQILADLQRRGEQERSSNNTPKLLSDRISTAVAELIDQNAANDDMIRERIRSTEQVAADNLNSPIEEMSSGVRFSHPAETVKETTTEVSRRQGFDSHAERQADESSPGQVIRGPAGAPAIERKTIKTYNRTGSEILADAPPSHVREEIEEIIQGGDDPDAHLEHSPGDMPIGQEQETSTEIMQGPPRSRSGGARSTVAPVTNMADLPNGTHILSPLNCATDC